MLCVLSPLPTSLLASLPAFFAFFSSFLVSSCFPIEHVVCQKTVVGVCSSLALTVYMSMCGCVYESVCVCRISIILYQNALHLGFLRRRRWRRQRRRRFQLASSFIAVVALLNYAFKCQPSVGCPPLPLHD